MFVKRKSDNITVLLVYVDNMFVTIDDCEEIDKLKKMLATEFELKDLGKLRYFLGIEMTRSFISQILDERKCTLYLLKEMRNLRCRLVRTPIEANHKLSIKDGQPLNNEGKGMYQ